MLDAGPGRHAPEYGLRASVLQQKRLRKAQKCVVHIVWRNADRDVIDVGCWGHNDANPSGTGIVPSNTRKVYTKWDSQSVAVFDTVLDVAYWHICMDRPCGASRRHLFGLVTECGQLARDMVSRHAGLDADEARRQVHKP